jgi:hypothetical protein
MFGNLLSSNRGPMTTTVMDQYVFWDDFETATPKNGWIYGNSANRDSTAPYPPLRGTRSLQTVANNSTCSLRIPPMYEGWVFQLNRQRAAFSEYHHLFSGNPSITVNVGFFSSFGHWGNIGVNANCRFRNAWFDDFVSYASIRMPQDSLITQPIYSWTYFKIGTGGSNGVMAVYLSTTPERPASPNYIRTNLNSTTPFDAYFWPGDSGSSNGAQLDYLRISRTEIGSYPP